LSGVTYFCETEDGGRFITEEGATFNSMNQFCESMVKRSTTGGRKISAYETVEVFLKEKGQWQLLGKVYDGDCTSIN
jgi:hypothetical protein